MNPMTHDILRLALDGLVVVAMILVLGYYVLRARKRTAAVKEEQRQAAEMLDVPPPEDRGQPADRSDVR